MTDDTGKIKRITAGGVTVGQHRALKSAIADKGVELREACPWMWDMAAIYFKLTSINAKRFDDIVDQLKGYQEEVGEEKE